MFFVIDKLRLQRIISIVRDDRTPKSQGPLGSFMRLEAKGGNLTLAGQEAQATIPATVYEEGVLFLRITSFRRLLGMISGEKTLAVQVNKDGMFVDNVTFSLENCDMLLYVDPDRAPALHPEDVSRAEAATPENELDLPLWRHGESHREQHDDGHK